MGIPFYPSLFSPSEDNDTDSLWEETKRLLEANPHLITLELLVSVLKQHPPTFVVEFLLSHDPLLLSLLDMPEQQKGPTPLQVAVAEGCNVCVVKLLVQACPWALCVTNVNAPEDPLSLAKRLDQQDLQDLLQRPLVQWLQEAAAAAAASQQPCNHTLQSSIHHKHHHHHHRQQQQQHLQQEQQEDLANVKLMCARLLKRNQQLSKDIKLCQTTIQSLSMIQSSTTVNRTPEQTPNAETPLNDTTVQIRLEEEAVLNEVARNELVEWQQDMEQQLLVLFHHYHHHKAEQPLSIRVQEHEGEGENNPPPASTTKEQGRESQRLLFNRRPNRKNICRPFL